MAWKDSFENTVDAVVDEFAQYLARLGNLSASDQARAQEICRDFCAYLCKDVRQANKMDYVIYEQLHAFTPEAEADYERFLGLIKDFCANNNLPSLSTLGKKSPMDAPMDMGKRSPLESSESNKRIRERMRRPTLAGSDLNINFDSDEPQQPSLESGFIKAPKTTSGLLTPPRSGSGMFSEPSLNSGLRHIPRVAEAASKNKISGMFQKTSAERPVSQQAATPARPIKAQNEGAPKPISQQEKTPVRPAEAVAQNKNGIDGFDFSFDDKFNVAKSSSANEKAVRRDSIADVVNVKQDNTGIRQPESTTSDANNLRSVKSVNYDFSEEGRRRLLAVEDKTEEPKGEAIDKRLLKNFRPYKFENKFTIDCPTPDPNDYTPGKAQMLNVLLSLLPTTFGLCLTIIAFVFSAIAGGILFLVTVILLLIASPNLQQQPNQTVNATISSLIKAKRGRCYSAANKLMAMPKDESIILEPAALWEKDLLPMPQAIMARFKTIEAISLKTVSGSESKNALVVLFESGENYFIVPLVRLEGKWYAVDASLVPRSLTPKA